MGPEGRRERFLFLEKYLLEVAWNDLDAHTKLRLQSVALNRRIALVREIKRNDGNPSWSWNPGEPLDEKDDVAQTFMGTGTWSIFLPEVMSEELAGVSFTEESIEVIEKRFEIDSRAAVRNRREAGVPWWLPAEAWLEGPSRNRPSA